jgi:hypothetical protein
MVGRYDALLRAHHDLSSEIASEAQVTVWEDLIGKAMLLPHITYEQFGPTKSFVTVGTK